MITFNRFCRCFAIGLVVLFGHIAVVAGEESLATLHKESPLTQRFVIDQLPVWLEAIATSGIDELNAFIETVCTNGYVPDNGFLIMLAYQRLAEDLDDKPLEILDIGRESCRIVHEKIDFSTTHSLAVDALIVVAPETLLEWALSDEGVNEDEQGEKSSVLFQLSAHTDAAELIRKLEQLPPEDYRREAIHAAFHQWVVSDPESAIIELKQRLENVKDPYANVQNEEDARRISETILQHGMQSQQYLSLLEIAIESYIENYSERPLDEIVSVLGEGYRRTIVVQQVKLLSQSNPEGAFELINELVEFQEANAIQDHQLMNIYSTLLFNWGNVDMHGMLSYIQNNDRSRDNWLTGQALSTGLRQMAIEEPLRSLEIIDSLAVAPEERNNLYVSAVQGWLAAQPDDALDWLENNQEHPAGRAFLESPHFMLPFRQASGHTNFVISKRLYDLLDSGTQQKVIGNILEMIRHTPGLNLSNWVDGLGSESGKIAAREYLEGQRIRELSEVEPLNALYEAGNYYGFDRREILRWCTMMAFDWNIEALEEWLQATELSEIERKELEDLVNMRKQ